MTDHIGGHIRHSHHVPSHQFDALLPTLLRRLEDKPVVVFHCALSQQRGPGAALKYLRAREARREGGGGGTAEPAPQQEVFVLDRGFAGWQEVYGPDEALTEAWRKELWEDGY